VEADGTVPSEGLIPEVETERYVIEENRCVIGSDVGGTKMAVGAVDARGAIILRHEAPSPARDGEKMVTTLVELVNGCIEAARSEGFEVVAVGIGAAGFILHAEGVLMEAPNIAWSMVPLEKISTEATGLPSFLDNDANAAAAGEHFAGICQGVDDFIYLTLGTGIGGGIFAGGRLYRGHRGTAAELGHMTVDPNGPVCGCGRKGCLEALASGTALEREAAALARLKKGSLLLEMTGGDLELLTGEMVSAAAEKKDPAALEAFKRVAYYLGLGVVNLIHAFDPETVVLGGGVARSGHLLLDELNEVVAANGIPSLIAGTTITLSNLGGDAGLIGAGAIAWEGIGGPS
jgi:glucokinase